MSEREQIFIAMTDVMHPAYIDHWLHMENPTLSYFTPSDLIRNGRSDLVWGLIESLKSGAFL